MPKKSSLKSSDGCLSKLDSDREEELRVARKLSWAEEHGLELLQVHAVHDTYYQRTSSCLRQQLFMVVCGVVIIWVAMSLMGSATSMGMDDGSAHPYLQWQRR